ncbi:MAG: hypothetical protein SFW09_12460 [Hyphomicrobiaceae bacterium]|nr:hypothetical protein [Hyphomicrobiaceae bacterium]
MAGEADAVARVSVTERLLLLAVAVVEALALFGLARAEAPVLAFGAVHAAALAAIGLLVLLARARGRDTAVALLALVACTAIGPAGALGAALLGVTGGQERSRRLIERWYERIAMSTAIDPEMRLHADVEVGRMLDPSAPSPRAFPTVMTSGRLVERQVILGLIARHFDPAYLPTLKTALESPEPVLRVQAAAVAAHVGPAVRQRLRDRLAALPGMAEGQGPALTALAELELLIGSGLLDETERLQAREAAAQLGDRIVVAPAARPPRFASGGDVAAETVRRDTLERLLLERRRFADLRALRSAERIAARHPAARLRRLGSRRPRPGAAA